ncbi:sensor histidine kinase KdpD [Azonexus sp.]|uniref:sensor histidine kinase n=1 Tax=Azonexus sp. TaxID=1872668 RepID=UPI0027BA4A12|nr:HAMP domain-containing sensor histidine kinase [Azonexus sp.]
MARVFALDPKTLSFAVGLGNLVFALLATLYVAKTRTSHPALETWRWGRLLAGCGFLTNLASSALPELVPAVLGNLLHTLAVSLDIAAYCLLLDREGWRRPLLVLAAVSLLLQLLVVVLGGSHGLLLLVFSGLGVVFYGTLSTLLFRASQHDRLLKLIAWIDLLMALVLLVRVLKGLAVMPLVRFDNDSVTLLLYLMLYLVVTINGFGFLLLAKQKDDKALYRALDELAQADESRHEFLAQVSHEFRTPAALIKASLDSLRIIGGELPPSVVHRLDNIRLATQRLNDLANTLLTHDRLNRQSMLFQPVHCELGEQVRQVLAFYPPETPVVADLPDAPLALSADPAQLRIAMHNLIDNALEHNPPAGSPVRVFLRSTAAMIEICVADSGAGISDSEKPEVFKRFYNPAGHFTRGVGLSIVQGIARNHGGDISVRDNTPVGTIMVLRLPKVH